MTQRYGRLVRRLDIDTHLRNLRHYSATELIAAGVDVRTVAGRLGHSGGGVTTLRVYAAWLAEADQRAAGGLLARMPERPAAVPLVPRALTSPKTPRERIAAELHTRIVGGEFPDGGHLPGIKELAGERGVAVSTVHRAFELLRGWGVLEGDPRERATVRTPTAEVPHNIQTTPQPAAVAVRRMLDFRLHSAGREVTAFSAEADPDSAADLGPLPRSAVRRAAGPEADVGDYELEVLADGTVLRTFVMAC